jgi:hypothetical protein
VRALTIVASLTALFAFGPAVAQTDQSKPGSVTGENQVTPPEQKGQLQPQGWTGPIDTQSGGAPPESPQGQSPPGMQAAPEGSSKKIVAPDK